MSDKQADGAPMFRENVVSVLIPVYNERAYLARLVQQVLDVELPGGLSKELILVDDGSSDGSRDIARDLERKHPDTVRAFFQEKNMGKGAAVRRAIQEMTGQIAIFQDADLEYDPGDYPRLIQPILEGTADVVYGSRFAMYRMKRVLNYHHALGNKFLTHFSNAFTGLDLTDMETCYKAFRADLLKTIPIRSSRFGIEPEITAKVAKRNCKIYEVPISYKGRTYMEGKKIGWKDGMSAIFTILKYWLIDDCFDEQYGQQILSSLSQARRFNRAVIRKIQPFLGFRILEIGAGIGNISRLLPLREKLIVSDADQTYLEILNQVFMYNDVVDVKHVDLEDADTFAPLRERDCDTVLCMNVLEHVEDDMAGLRNMCSVLPPGGRLVLIVPQYACLMGSYDKFLGHHRRYSRRIIHDKLEQAGLRPVRFVNFNFLAILGWFVNSKLLRRRHFNKWQIKIFDMLVPAMQLIERILPLPGISLICIAEPDSDSE